VGAQTRTGSGKQARRAQESAQSFKREAFKSAILTERSRDRNRATFLQDR
jgi:hypothetical protein